MTLKRGAHVSANDTARAAAGLESLVQPLGGLMSQAAPLRALSGEPSFPTYGSFLGDLNPVLSPYSRLIESDVNGYNGAGGAIEPELARIRAIAEGLERYSTCVFDERQFIWATGAELGHEALDLDTVPRCSETELAHPRCPLVAPDKRLPIRWVRGVSLFDARPVWLPAVMVYLKLSMLGVGERFTLPISTGCAAHGTLDRALLSGIGEVIERDAISLVWLQQMPLPRIELDATPDWLNGYLERQNRQAGGVETLLFDATTDLGIPTVYGLQISPSNQALAALVMCSTELDPAQAVAKVIREAASSRFALQQPRQVPENWDDFSDISHGASFMGRPAQLPAFDFLRHSRRSRRLSEMPVLRTGDARRDLIGVLRTLRERGMEAFAVDLTTDEAMRAGTNVVRVVIPALQPLSVSYRARYLGHPRLYDAPQRMGYLVRAEGEINPWPQPFA